MTVSRVALILLVFFLYCGLELVWSLREHRRRIPLRVGILRTAILLFLFAASMGLLAGVPRWLSLGGAAVLAALFPLQVSALAKYRNGGKPSGGAGQG